MRQTIARVHQALAWLIMILIVTQIYFAGMALFGAESWTFHFALGSSIWLSSPLLLIVALIGRLGRRIVGLSALLLVLTTVQIALPMFRLSAPFVAAFHPLNAMVLMILAYVMARKPSRLVAPTSGRAATRLHDPASREHA